MLYAEWLGLAVSGGGLLWIVFKENDDFSMMIKKKKRVQLTIYLCFVCSQHKAMKNSFLKAL